MSIRQLIPSLGKELDELCARVAFLEGLLGIGGVSPQKSFNADGSCRICGITWQLGMKCFAQHMTGKRHKKNLAKLSNIPPPSSSKLPSPSSSLCGRPVEHCTVGSARVTGPAPTFTSSSSDTGRVEPQYKNWTNSISRPCANKSEQKETDVPPKGSIVWYGTGHTKYTTTTSKMDTVMTQMQTKVLGILQSITCMEEYENKSLEELHWEDFKAGRKSCAGKSPGISYKKSESVVKEGGLIDERQENQAFEEEFQPAEFVPGKIWKGWTPELKHGEGGDLLKKKGPVKEQDGVADKKFENLADEELHLAEDEVKGGEGGELMKEKEVVEEVDCADDVGSEKLAVKEFPCADSIDERKVLTPASSMKGSDSGKSLKEMGSTNVREKDATIEEKAVGGESVITQIISMRPKLKRKVKD